MKVFGLLRCFFASHSPNRRKVRRSPTDLYIGTCLHCGAPIKRIRRDKWVRDWARTFGFGGKPSSGVEDED
ncbi:hypothetical protein [Novosphingobium sp. KACC 22771]|uniref:hypothetical protein n=1 Tax=Novosphingobium sp. KACC 22771 TaxID=3025670 RepID=UPI002366560E|nr:hypothetical protein [Novosphingobium sp. KACC 22771]WDF72193.1 hypothetical protein PQ467_15585 [Novosphingobium sp. KACC 22771]